MTPMQAEQISVSLDRIHEHLQFIAERMSEAAQAPSHAQLVAMFMQGLLSNSAVGMTLDEMVKYATAAADKVIIARAEVKS